MFSKEQLAEAYQNFNGTVTVIKAAKARKAEKTFNLDKALYNRPERRGDSRRRAYVAPIERV